MHILYKPSPHILPTYFVERVLYQDLVLGGVMVLVAFASWGGSLGVTPGSHSLLRVSAIVFEMPGTCSNTLGSCAAREYNKAISRAIRGDDFIFIFAPIDSAAMLSLLILSSHFLLSQDVCQIVRATKMTKHSHVCWPALSPTVRPWISSSAAVNAEKKYLVITPFSTRVPPRPHGEASM